MIKNNRKTGLLAMICLLLTLTYSCGDTTKSNNLISANKPDTVNQTIDLSNVREAKYARTLATGTKDDGRVSVSCLLPAEVETGNNPIQFVLHNTDKDHLSELDGYSIALEPFMPAMGHGSSGNKNAEGTGEGHYQGTVQLSMPRRMAYQSKIAKGWKCCISG